MLRHPNGSEMSRAPGPRDGRPAQRGVKGKPMRNLNDAWEIIWECARLEDMRRHDCQRTYAPRASALGESLPMIGRLFGHTQVETTHDTRILHRILYGIRRFGWRIALRWTFSPAIYGCRAGDDWAC